MFVRRLGADAGDAIETLEVIQPALTLVDLLSWCGLAIGQIDIGWFDLNCEIGSVNVNENEMIFDTNDSDVTLIWGIDGVLMHAEM